MKTRLKIITPICLLLLLVTGCQDQASTKTSPQTEMSGRLDAALAMEEGALRNSTLCQFAPAAAKAGEVELVLKAIAEIRAGKGPADSMSVECSKELAKQGRTNEATTVAKQVADVAIRDNLLGAIARGEFKP